MSKKKRKLLPRCKRMNRHSRLQSAKATNWVKLYSGKNVIRGYCRWYAVDPLCAVHELRLLGVSISVEQEEKLRRSAMNKSMARSQKRKKQDIDIFPDYDETFAYIAGCTSGGLPYGVTWEEMGEIPPWRENDRYERIDTDGPC